MLPVFLHSLVLDLAFCNSLSIECKYQVGFGSENLANGGTAIMKHKHHQYKVNPLAFVSAYQFLSKYFKDNFQKNTKVKEKHVKFDSCSVKMYPRKPRGRTHFRTSELSQSDSCCANNYPCKSLKANSNFTPMALCIIWHSDKHWICSCGPS